MKRFVFWNGIFSGLAGWVLLMHWPLVPQPVVKVVGLTPAVIENEAKREYAMRESREILAAYPCGSDYSGVIARESLILGISPRLVAADIAVESSCRANVVSPAQAVGLMQITRVHKVDGDLTDPEINIAAGTRILAANIHAHGTREGLRRYFGITEGSTKSDEYADRVLMVAYRR